MCKNNIKLICLTFIHCTCKFEKHKQSFVSEKCEQTFPNKKPKQPKAHEKHKQSFVNEKCEQTFPNKMPKQPKAHEKHKQSFPCENYIRNFHKKA